MDTKLDVGNNSEILLTSVSAREVLLRYHALCDVRERGSNGDYVEAIKVEETILSEGSLLYIKLLDKRIQPFKVNNIKRSIYDNRYVLYSTALTKASKYIMPMLSRNGETRNHFKFTSNFVNCYVGTESEGYLENIILVYRYSGSVEYQKFEQKLKNHELYDSMMDLDEYHVMYIFNMTNADKLNFEKFKKGKYSKFSEDYKKKILKFTINPAITSDKEIKDTEIYGVLYRTDKQINKVQEFIGSSTVDIKKEKLELLSIPDEGDEVYTGEIEIPKDAMSQYTKSLEKNGEM